MEGWLNFPVRWRVVAPAETGAEWQRLLERGWTGRWKSRTRCPWIGWRNFRRRARFEVGAGGEFIASIICGPPPAAVHRSHLDARFARRR